MNNDFQLLGKTISGVVASPGNGRDPHKIWMLQFSDGTHVEFVSPTARRRLNRVTSGTAPVVNGTRGQQQTRANAA